MKWILKIDTKLDVQNKYFASQSRVYFLTICSPEPRGKEGLFASLSLYIFHVQSVSCTQWNLSFNCHLVGLVLCVYFRRVSVTFYRLFAGI